MDDCGGSPYKGLIATVRKKRSQTPRRPRTGNLTVTGSHDQSPLASPSDDANSRKGIYNRNYSVSRDSSAKRFKGDYSKKRQEDGGSSTTYNNARRGDATNPRFFSYIMDDCGGSPYKGLIATVRKKRSQTPRRPRTGNLTFTGSHDQSPLASLSDDANSGKGIYYRNYSISRDSSANRFKGDYSKKRQEDGGSSAAYNNARWGDATNPRHVAHVRQLGNAGDGIANDSKLKKLTSKVGGETSISQTKNSSYRSSGSLLSSKSAQPSDASQPRQKLIPKDKSSEDGPPADNKSELKRISCKDFPRGTFGASKSDVRKKLMKNVLEKQGEKRRENLKIQRRPRRRLILNGLDEDEDDDEIHYSEKLKLGGELLGKTRSPLGLKADESSEDDPPTDKKSGLKGISCKDFPRGTFGARKSNVEKLPMKNVLEKQGEKPHQNLKIQRMPRKTLVLDGLDEVEDDDEIHYSEKLKLGGELLRKTRSHYQGLKANKNEMLEDVGSSGKEVKRISNQGFDQYADYEEQLLSDDGQEEQVSDYEEEEQVSDYEDELLSDYEEEELLSDREDEMWSDYEEEELISDSEEQLLSDGEAKRRKKEEKRMKESYETSVEKKSEISLTTRQRALLSRRDSSATSVNQIGYPYGRPPAPPQKQKEKLSEVEQQQKKAEAAQRRRIQNENAARESEADTIRKVLGQDSNRKKREEKIKQQEELAQEKAAKELAPNTIRTVMGPAGTTVTFSLEIGLPSIFNSKPRSYPLPRETCAAPSCVNLYKYRNSKSNLPICSFRCYQATLEKMQN